MAHPGMSQADSRSSPGVPRLPRASRQGKRRRVEVVAPTAVVGSPSPGRAHKVHKVPPPPPVDASAARASSLPLVLPSFEFTTEDHTHFLASGFSVVKQFLEPRAVQYIRHQFDRVYRDLSVKVHDEWVMSLHQATPPDEDNWLWRLASAPKLLDAVERILGTPDLVLFSTQLATKRPGHGTEVPWHQDGERCCTIWVPLDTVTERTGALRVLPGMHKHGRLPFRRLESEGDVAMFEFFHQYHLYATCTRGLESTPTVLSIPAGGLEIHDPALPHASGPNRSRHSWRRAIVMRYQPANEPLVGGDITHWKTGHSFRKLNYLVRGSHPQISDTGCAISCRDGSHAQWSGEGAGLARRPGGDVWYDYNT
eukprot:m.12007 g.12007  ORF g.12007 m.12007 type:complete len:367 (+) comp7603_c0_seq1:246-1346(+)